MNPVRILHCLTRVYSGGVEQRRLVMAKGLRRSRYEHAIIAQEARGALPDLLRAEGWAIHEIGLAPHILSSSWHNRAHRVAQEFRPDIVHGAVIEGIALANGIGLRMPNVKVISEETSDPVNRSWRANLLMRAMCLQSDVVLGVSPKVGDYLRHRARVSVNKIRVINNAVAPAPNIEIEELRLLRGNMGLSASDLVIGSVGRLVDSHKRFSDLIRALGLLRDQGMVAKLLIVGDGPDLAMLEELAKELRLENAVVFAGYQGDVRRWYPLMDVFALASAHEAFGLVLVEAMLAGVPVVATRVGGIPYVLGDGAAGCLVKAEDLGDLAQAIAHLLRDKAIREALGSAGQQHALRHFSAGRYCDEIDALYQELLR